MSKSPSYFPIPKNCPNCSSKNHIEYIDSSYVYGKSYGMIYICKCCESFVGVHKGTNIPLGIIANKEHRELKKTAHYYFDKLWSSKKNKSEARAGAYKWLAQKLDLVELHFGWLGKAELKLAIDVLVKDSLSYSLNTK